MRFPSATHRAMIILAMVFQIWGLGACPAMADTTTTSFPYQGVVKIDTVLTSPRFENIHILKIDLTAKGVLFKLSPPTPPNPPGTLGDPVGSPNLIANETRVQKTLEYLKQEKAQFAVNVMFFGEPPASNGGTYLTGIAASKGNVYSSFEASPKLSYAVVPHSPGMNIDVENHAQIVFRGSADDKIAASPGGADIAPYNTFCGSAQIITNGVVTIPTYADAGGVLAAGGGYKTENSWYEQLKPRTVIGMNKDEKTLFILTVDRSGESQGATVGEMADYLLKNYGVYNALNLDGGGSTTLSWVDPVTNIPADINVSSNNNGDRAVGASLAIFALPMP